MRAPVTVSRARDEMGEPACVRLAVNRTCHHHHHVMTDVATYAAYKGCPATQTEFPTHSRPKDWVLLLTHCLAASVQRRAPHWTCIADPSPYALLVSGTCTLRSSLKAGPYCGGAHARTRGSGTVQ